MLEGVVFDEVRDKQDRTAGVIKVPDYQYPMLGTFADIKDPASVQLVNPANLATSFGPDGRLKAVALEVTDDAVTVGVVEAVLGWLIRVLPNHLDGNNCGTLCSERLGNSLSSNSF